MERRRLLILMFFMPIAVCLIMGLMFCPFFDGFLSGWLNGMKFFYFIAGAPLHVGFLLALVLKIDEIFAMGCGAGIYFGTWLGGSLIDDAFSVGDFAYLSAFVVSSLISYIVWIKIKK